MHIGFLTPAWPGENTANGISTAVSELVKGFRSSGHEVSVFAENLTDNSDGIAIELPSITPISVLGRLRWRIDPGGAHHRDCVARIVEAVSARHRESRLDVLVMEETFGWAGSVQEYIEVPVVATLHGPWFLLGALQAPEVRKNPINRNRANREKSSLREVAGITAPSQVVLDSTLIETGMLNSPTEVHRNPITPCSPLDYVALNESRRGHLLFVGRFDYLKGGDVLLEAFSRLVGDGTDAYLTLVGPDCGVATSDSGTVMLPAALSALPPGIKERITVTGPLPKPEIQRLRRCHPISVIASRFENLNYTLLESLANGAATIATAVGGPKEVICDGENGLLVPPGDPIALADACAKLISDPVLCSRLGAAGHQTVVENYAPEVVARRMVPFLERVITRKNQ